MNKFAPNKKIIGFTCGAFDLCHAGHMLMFKEAKEKCNHLIVGLQEDPSLDNGMYRDKNKNKPVMCLKERKIILNGLKYIDEIFTYKDEKDLYKKLRKLKYDVRIIGRDWKGKKYTGYDLPHKIYYNSRSHSYSTSELRKRVAEAEEKLKK